VGVDDDVEPPPLRVAQPLGAAPGAARETAKCRPSKWTRVFGGRGLTSVKTVDKTARVFYPIFLPKGRPPCSSRETHKPLPWYAPLLFFFLLG